MKREHFLHSRAEFNQKKLIPNEWDEIKHKKQQNKLHIDETYANKRRKKFDKKSSTFQDKQTNQQKLFVLTFICKRMRESEQSGQETEHEKIIWNIFFLIYLRSNFEL